MTGPIAAPSSSLHGPDTQTLNATQAKVRTNAIAKRTVRRSPEAGSYPRQNTEASASCMCEIKTAVGDSYLVIDRR